MPHPIGPIPLVPFLLVFPVTLERILSHSKVSLTVWICIGYIFGLLTIVWSALHWFTTSLALCCCNWLILTNLFRQTLLWQMFWSRKDCREDLQSVPLWFLFALAYTTCNLQWPWTFGMWEETNTSQGNLHATERPCILQRQHPKFGIEPRLLKV